MVRQRPTKTTGLSYGESLKPMDWLLESGLVLRWNLDRTWEPTWQHPVSAYIGQRWQRWSEGANGTPKHVQSVSVRCNIYVYIYVTDICDKEMWHTSVTDSDPYSRYHPILPACLKIVRCYQLKGVIGARFQRGLSAEQGVTVVWQIYGKKWLYQLLCSPLFFLQKNRWWLELFFPLRFHGIGICWTESPAFIDYFCTARLEDVFAHCIPAIASMIAKVERLARVYYYLWRHFPEICYCRTLNSHCHPKQMSSTSIHCHWGSGLELRLTILHGMIEKWLINGLRSSSIHIHGTIHGTPTVHSNDVLSQTMFKSKLRTTPPTGFPAKIGAILPYPRAFSTCNPSVALSCLGTSPSPKFHGWSSSPRVHKSQKNMVSKWPHHQNCNNKGQPKFHTLSVQIGIYYKMIVWIVYIWSIPG